MSADGQTLVYVGIRNGTTQLFRRSLTEHDPSPIPGTENAYDPFFSPDGDWVDFFADGPLRRVSLAGGSPLTICPTPQLTFGASWGMDDMIIFSQRVSGLSRLFRVSTDGGEPEQLTALDSDERAVGHPWPDVLPGGKWILFTTFEGASTANPPGLLSLETGERRELAPDKEGRFVPTGHIVFMRGSTLWAMGFDPVALEVTADPESVVDGIEASPVGSSQYASADNGTLVYLVGGSG